MTVEPDVSIEHAVSRMLEPHEQVSGIRGPLLCACVPSVADNLGPRHDKRISAKVFLPTTYGVEEPFANIHWVALVTIRDERQTQTSRCLHTRPPSEPPQQGVWPEKVFRESMFCWHRLQCPIVALCRTPFPYSRAKIKGGAVWFGEKEQERFQGTIEGIGRRSPGPVCE